jgi:hypothetical protein
MRFKSIAAVLACCFASSAIANSRYEIYVEDYTAGNAANPDCSGSNPGQTKMAIDSAVTAAAAANKGLVFKPGTTYCINGPIVMQATQASGNVPLYVEGNGAILKAAVIPPATTVTRLIELRNVHAQREHFLLRNLVLDGSRPKDANGDFSYAPTSLPLATNGLYINGGQHFEISGVEVQHMRDSGVLLQSASGNGIYYSTFRNVFSHDNGMKSTQTNPSPPGTGDGFEL